MDKYCANIHQTDERTFYLSTMLKGKKFATPTHIFAPNVLIEAKTLADIEDGATVFYGRCLDEAKSLANSRDIRLLDFNSSERFQAVNSRLTAEGCLKTIIEHSQKSIAECHMLVLGFGRTGAAVSKILSKLDISFDVATTASKRPANAFAKRIIQMKEFDFTPYDVIINTVPSPIISDKELMSMKKDAVYIELASLCAINLDYAKYLGIDADIYPALPAKTCPYSAARAMFDFIEEAVK